MRGLFRGNSFSSRLSNASGAFYMSTSAFLLVLLALALQHTFRLNNEIERLHWQLALSQFMGGDTGRGRQSEVSQKLLEKGSTADKTDPNEAKMLLEDVVAHLPKHSSSPTEDALETKPLTETELSNPLIRFLVGISLAISILLCVYIWMNLDALANNELSWVADRLGYTEKKAALSGVIAYEVDSWFSTHKYAKVLALLSFTLILVVCGSLALYSVSNISLYDSLWGCFAGVGIDWTFSDEWSTSNGISSVLGRLVSLFISIGGLLITALLLGIVSEIISDKVDDMKKGTSRVLESGHSLILGWSDEVVPIIKQISLANKSVGGCPIVVLSERDKQEMENEISTNDIELYGSRVICRSGNPLLRHDLEKVSVQTARSIIVLADQQSPDQSDARVLRVVLSLVAFHEAGTLKGYIVVELCDMDNEPLVKLVGSDLVQTVVSHDIIGRLMIQCAQQPGLANVWEEIMGFEGCEFYLAKWPQITGKSFKEVMIMFPEAVPIGVKKATTKEILINVDDDYIFRADDELIVIAEDEDTYEPAHAPYVQSNSCPKWKTKRHIEKILFCGWRRDMDDLILVLDDFVPCGSELWLYNDVPTKQREELLVQGGLNPETGLKNLKLEYKTEKLRGDLITRKKLAALDPATFSSILILADESATGADIADADSRNLATLLLLRDLMSSPSGTGLSSDRSRSLKNLRSFTSLRGKPVIVSEILDARTRHLITELNISEYVMSNELVSMTLAMVAESADVNQILQELFSKVGSELYVFPAEKYIHQNEADVSFFELMVRCRQHTEVAIGYRALLDGKIIINPSDKNEKTLNLDNVESLIVVAHGNESS